MVTLSAHLDGKGDGVQQADGLFIIPVLLVGVAGAPDGDIVHGRDLHDFRLFLWQVEFLVLLLVIKGHGYILLFVFASGRAWQVVRVRAVRKSRSSMFSMRK